MKKSLLTIALLSLITSAASADICGITTTAQGRTAANIIDAQIKRSPTKKATLLDTGNMSLYEVSDALVSNKNGADLGDAKYFDFKVKMADGSIQSIDIGYTYVVMGDGKTAVSLDQLTGCGGYQEKSIIDISQLGLGRRAE